MKISFSRVLMACAMVCGGAFVASAEGVALSAGCDFTNATLTVTAASATPSIVIKQGNTQVLVVSDPTIATSDYTYNLTLAAGSLYTYAVTVGSTVYTGEILTANLNAGFSSSAPASGTASVDVNGAWLPTLSYSDTGYATVTGSTFTVTSALPASKIDVIESVQKIEEGFDAEDLTELSFTGAQAMVVVVTNETAGALEWYAWFGGTAPTALSGWTKLTGLTPVSGTEYTVRSEFDYTTSTPKVSVCVKAGDSAYTRLEDSSGNIWFALYDTSKTAVSAVAICGNVSFKSLTGQTSNANLFTDGTTEYADSTTALASGEALTLLTNASVAPTTRGKWTITNGSYTLTNTGSLKSKFVNNTLWAYETEEAKIGETEYVFLDEAFAAAEENDTITLLTNVTTTAATTLSKAVVLDLAGHDYLPTGTLTLGSDAFIITNTVIDAGCVKFTTLTDDSSSLKIAGGLWADNTTYASKLLTDFTFYGLTNTVTRGETTFAYQAKKSTTISVGGNDVKIEDDFITKNIGTGKTTEEIQEALVADRTGTGNEMPLIQSYALTLDPNDSTAKPIASSVQNSSSTQMTLSLGNVKVNEGSGVPVKFALKSATTPAGLESATAGTAQTDPSFTVDLPTSGDAVKYYSIDIQFGN